MSDRVNYLRCTECSIVAVWMPWDSLPLGWESVHRSRRTDFYCPGCWRRGPRIKSDGEQQHRKVYASIETDDEDDRPCVVATCSRCGHESESYGTGPRSINRCLFMLKKTCPEGERNWYTADKAEADPVEAPAGDSVELEGPEPMTPERLARLLSLAREITNAAPGAHHQEDGAPPGLSTSLVE